MTVRRLTVALVILVVLCLCLARRTESTATTSSLTKQEMVAVSQEATPDVWTVSTPSCDVAGVELPADLALAGEVNVVSSGIPMEPYCRKKWLPP